VHRDAAARHAIGPATHRSQRFDDPDRITLHILGNACPVLKAAMSPTIDATFPCAH
jgi:hypothetical protein